MSPLLRVGRRSAQAPCPSPGRPKNLPKPSWAAVPSPTSETETVFPQSNLRRSQRRAPDHGFKLIQPVADLPQGTRLAGASRARLAEARDVEGGADLVAAAVQFKASDVLNGRRQSQEGEISPGGQGSIEARVDGRLGHADDRRGGIGVEECNCRRSCVCFATGIGDAVSRC